MAEPPESDEPDAAPVAPDDDERTAPDDDDESGPDVVTPDPVGVSPTVELESVGPELESLVTAVP